MMDYWINPVLTHTAGAVLQNRAAGIRRARHLRPRVLGAQVPWFQYSSIPGLVVGLPPNPIIDGRSKVKNWINGFYSPSLSDHQTG